MKKQEYIKGLVDRITNNAIVWVYLTYILALMGREQIAETLSAEIVKVVIGTVLAYAIKALIENIFKYNVGKVKKKEETENDQTEVNE